MKTSIRYKLDIQLVTLICTVVALILAGYVAYEYWLLSNELKLTEKVSLEQRTQLEKELEEVEKDRLNLSELSKYQQSIIDSFQGQISSIGNTVGTLEKLAQTDKELLKKYSKVYFLNENYVPAKLTQVEDIYISEKNGGNLLIHADVWPFLKRLLEDARLRIEDALKKPNCKSHVASAKVKIDEISELEKKVDRLYSSSKVVGNIVFFALVVLFILVFTV